ncbi:MAG: hypothetical protein Q3988_01325 [Gemella sp.]|nr:hypothetical protein [Gemella sp.]
MYIKYLNNFVRLGYFVIILVILLAIFFSNDIEYKTKLAESQYNFYLFSAGAVFLIAILFLSKFIDKAFSNKTIKFLYLFQGLIFIFHNFIIYNYYFLTDWDVRDILIAAQNLAVEGKIKNVEYFSQYPNNIFIVWIFAGIIKFSNLLGLENYNYFILLSIMAGLYNFVAIIVYKTSRILFKNREYSILTYIYYNLLVMFSPWVSIPYSDSLGLIFPISILYLYLRYLKIGKFSYGYVILIALLAYFSLAIKPQSFLIFIAIIIYEIFRERNIQEKFKFILLAVFLVFSCSQVQKFTITEKSGIDKEKSVGILHFVKMGLNNQTNGIYYYPDVKESISYETREERNYYNLLEIENRIEKFGITGLSNHVLKKILINYNDGTFAWGVEGEFYREILKEKSLISKFFRSIYYSNGENYKYFVIVSQANWLVVLAFTIFSISISSKEKEIYLIQLTLIALFLFLIIFEARSRYLFTNLPLFIILFVYSIKNLEYYIKGVYVRVTKLTKKEEV